jgi:DNA-binding IclR family transcriptional regulator
MKLTTAAHAAMRELALDVAEVVLLTRVVDGSVICLEREDGAVGEFRISHEVGQQLPLNANASAYALLAWLPAEVSRDLLMTGNVALAAQPRASVIDGVMRRLAETRGQGYAVSRGELDPEIVEVAAPIRGKGGTVVGAISVTAVSSLVPNRRIPDLAGAVHRAAGTISDRLTA